ncbi:hypothetical protein MKW98_018866 [Papaver atlanticum]|uniref:Uncharacterized protein n=1 Tax=Papaver atlanticum TaxID=357466 RepID=A0AAD4XX89_9MAGN|nr:hypothetical protein MKW98_018866 [Papaver atlanticum]
MASLKQFSLTHVVIALIFGVIWASSPANAGRTTDGVRQQENARNINCHMLTDVCTGRHDCTSKCEKHSFHQAICTPLRSDLFGDKYCCCY